VSCSFKINLGKEKIMMNLAKKEGIVPWEKGEMAISQSEVYSRLPNDSTVLFYQSGDIEKGEFIIEIACNVMATNYFNENCDKITDEIKNNARGRKIIKFNN